MPKALDAFACGSRSTRSVARSEAAIDAARLTVVVVFPTPPFWFTTAMTRAAEWPEPAAARLSPQLIGPLEDNRDGTGGGYHAPRGASTDVPRGTSVPYR